MVGVLLSAPLMVVLIAMLAGVTELVALVALFGANAAMILFGLVQERLNLDRNNVDWRPFIYGCVIGAVPWIAIAAQLVISSAEGNDVPGFVIAIFVSLLLLFNSFAVNMWLQYRRRGRLGVACDGSEEAHGALELACALGRASSARLRIITVFEPVAFGALATGRTGGASASELLRAEFRNALDTAVADGSDRGAPERRFPRGLGGGRARCREHRTRPAGDRLAPLRPEHRGARRTTHALMRKAACPVLVVPRAATG